MRYPEFHFRWEWQLQSSPEQLWPLVSDTNRFNRDTGLPDVHPQKDQDSENGQRHLRFSRAGLNIEWEEQPFEWVRPQRFGVVRRYRSGPVSLLRVLVELEYQPNGGALLLYQTWVTPRNFLGLVTIHVFMAFNHRNFGSVLRRYDERAASTTSLPDRPSGVRFSPGGKARIAMVQRSLLQQAIDPSLVVRLVETVEKADGFALARLRPYELADSWGVQRQPVLDLFLRATRSGLFDLQWDLLCPLCRGPKESALTLKDIKSQVHCDSCNIDFTVNFDRLVELTFRLNPAIRRVETHSFCVGSPQLTPHIVAQQLLAPGLQRDLTLSLEPGRYRLRSPALPGGQFLAAASNGTQEAVITADDAGWPHEELQICLAPTLRLHNRTSAERLFILERMAWSDQALTAAEATCLQVFRDLFSNEVLRPGEQISVGSVTILFTDLRDSTRLYREIGDASAFGRVLDHFNVLRDAIVEEDGAVVKTIGDAIMAVFSRPVSALRATLKAQQQLAVPSTDVPTLYLKAGIHHGPCITVTLNERLDYFGSTVNIAARLTRLSSGTDIIISDTVRNDPEVAELLADSEQGLVPERFDAHLKGLDEDQFMLWHIHRH